MREARNEMACDRERLDVLIQINFKKKKKVWYNLTLISVAVTMQKLECMISSKRNTGESSPLLTWKEYIPYRGARRGEGGNIPSETEKML